jgi:outer membrane protein assembly factor BamB
MRRAVLVGLWGILLIGCVAAGDRQTQGEDWAQFRGPGGAGVSSGQVPRSWTADNAAWKTDLPGPGASSPIVVGDRVYVTCYSGVAKGSSDLDGLKRHLVCVNRGDGKILWQKEDAAKLPEEAKIREDHGYATNTPVADAERVVVFFGKSGVLAFSPEGEELWRADVGSQTNGWGSAASPIFVGDLVIVNASVESQSLMALDKRTGKEKWRARGINESWNTPIVVELPAGRKELAVAILGKVLGFDPATGEQLWSCDTDIRWYMVPGLVARDGVVYCIGGRSGGSLAVRAGGRGDVTRTHRLWTGRKGSNVPSPVLHRGHLYWVHEAQGIAYCAEAATGKLVYEERLPRAPGVYASPVLADDKLFIVARDGRVFVLPAKPAYEEPTVIPPLERGMFNSTPALAGGRVFLRTDKALYCLGKE